MAKFTQKIGSKMLLRIAAISGGGLALSGCVYDVGLGYASDGYGSGYGCDPYSAFDSYYDCDYGYGFSNIGYGGGWYDSFWYPGYGFYLFDNVGRRHQMHDHHRRYWGERRHRWYRENRGGGNGRNYRDGNNGGSGDWGRGQRGDGQNDRGPRSGRDRDDRPRGDGRPGRNGRGNNGNGAGAVQTPAPVVTPPSGRGDGIRGGRGNGGGNGGNGRWRAGDQSGAVRAPRPDRPNANTGGGGRNVRQSAPAVPQNQAPAPRVERPRAAAPRREVNTSERDQ